MDRYIIVLGTSTVDRIFPDHILSRIDRESEYEDTEIGDIEDEYPLRDLEYERTCHDDREDREDDTVDDDRPLDSEIREKYE